MMWPIIQKWVYFYMISLEGNFQKFLLQTAPKKECGYGEQSVNNVKSDLTVFGEFPWLAAIYCDSSFIGGGSILAPTIVLAPAHIIPTQNQTTLSIRAAEWDLGSTVEPYPYIASLVKAVYVHEEFKTDDYNNDIALLELDRELDFFKYAKPVCLPRSHEFPITKPCLLVGWDKTQVDRNENTSTPIKVEVPILDKSQCNEIFREGNVSPGSFGCVERPLRTSNIADMVASSLFCPSEDHPGQYYQLGVFTWNLNNTQNSVYSAFTNVLLVKSWIHKKLESLSIDPNYYMTSYTAKYGQRSSVP